MRKYIIAGLLVWLPLAITIWVLLWLLGLMDGMFSWLLMLSQAVLPVGADAFIESLRHVPGLEGTVVKVERAAARQERARTRPLHAQGGEAVADRNHRKVLTGQRGAQAFFKGRSLTGFALQHPLIRPQPQQGAARAQGGGIGLQRQRQTGDRSHGCGEGSVLRIAAQIEHVHQRAFTQRHGVAVHLQGARTCAQNRSQRALQSHLRHGGAFLRGHRTRCWQQWR